MRIKSYITFLMVSLLPVCSAWSTAQQRIVVSQDGKGDYKTIMAALSSLSDSSVAPRIIYIKKGLYKEKIYVEKHNIILQGEDKESVVITFSIAREEWRCQHADDWGVATMNIDGNDITLQNLTVVNNYGFENQEDRNVYCPIDSSLQKNISVKGHQMAVRTFNGTRFKAINCKFKSYAGDTMSPWNVRFGMYYFKDCEMEGGVDLYCPRGWAYAENCKFIAQRGEAAIWHDGSQVQDSKTVFNKCSFEGYDGFKLGRYHRDAQFFLFNCIFSENMADKAIYQAASKNTIQWGHRVYYYNCHKAGGDYAWFADNLSSASVSIDPREINAGWVFGNKWDPLKN